MMTASTFPLSLKDPARVFLRNRRALPLATGGPRACAEVDPVAATLGFADLSDNACSSHVSKVGLLLSFVLIVVDYDLLPQLLRSPLLPFLPRTGIRAARFAPVALKRILKYVHQLISSRNWPLHALSLFLDARRSRARTGSLTCMRGQEWHTRTSV